jgi:ribosome-associated protein
VVEELQVTPGCAIALDELEWRFSGSGGPGGQHANTANTRAEIRFDVTASASLSPAQQERIVARLGPVVRVVAADERSQARNRALALERLAARLADALHVAAPRHATAPTRAARRRRLESKRRRSSIKRLRSTGPAGDDD